MATDYWASSHNKKWITDRLTLHNSRLEDLAFVSAESLAFLNIFFANPVLFLTIFIVVLAPFTVISKIGKKLHFRQRVIATATVFFRRFYLKNRKAEENPSHIKSVISVANPIFCNELGVWSNPLDNHRLAEMEFYLVDELECNLTIFHPYRTLTILCTKETKDIEMLSESAAQNQIGEAGRTGVEGGERYWGTDVGKLVLDEKLLQLAWMIINDTYRTDVCLLYPPFLIAIAAIYLSLVNNDRIHASMRPQSTPEEMQVTPETTAPTPASNAGPTPAGATSPSQGTHTGTSTSSNPDPITFLASLNVSLATVATIAQEMMSFYQLSSRYVDESGPSAAAGNSSAVRNRINDAGLDAFFMDVDGKTPIGNGSVEKVRPKQMVEMVKRMRGEKERESESSMNSAGPMMSPATASSAHTIKGRAVNKRLERAQAAG